MKHRARPQEEISAITSDISKIGLSDYSHADQSTEIQALDVIEQRAEKGEISASVARKILDDNPRRFYGL